MASNDKSDLIEDILRIVLSDLADWKCPPLLPGIRPQYPDVLFDYEKRAKVLVSKVREALGKQDPEVLRSQL